MSTINPFNLKPEKIESSFRSWKELNSRPYDKMETDPYTKVRIILANGTEYEANWFKHNFARHCVNNDIRRALALMRRVEQQQQKAISSLKPMDENALEHTIAYEQLAIDLTAIMAQNETDAYVKAALDFALLEDFDHLYRFADLLEMEEGVKGEMLVGGYTEIMPGRPTISEHRHPYDDVRRGISNSTATPITKLNTAIITAAEQQTMNYYMNIGAFHTSDLGRKLFNEIAMIEEQHVTQYESLMDSSATWLEHLLMHEYTECYVYFSLMEEERDERIKALWERHFLDEVAHLHLSADLLKTYEKKEWQQVIPEGKFPTLLSFYKNIDNNKAYIRDILKNTVHDTAVLEEYADSRTLDKDYEFFAYNDRVNGSSSSVASHKVIGEYIAECGEDYRFETAPHPVPELRDRQKDNTKLGR